MAGHVLGVWMWKRLELTEDLVLGYRGRGFRWEEVYAILAKLNASFTYTEKV